MSDARRMFLASVAPANRPSEGKNVRCMAGATIPATSDVFAPTTDAPQTPMATDEPDDTLLAGRYRREEVLGRGANATTYRAVDTETDHPYALKELRVDEVESFEAVRLFEREASVLEELDHPGIPEYVDDFHREDAFGVALYLVQEYLPGDSLAERLASDRLSENEILGLLADVLDIAAYLHGRSPPVVHRDIKPDNILLRDGTTPALVDFGSVRAALRPAEQNQTVTGTVGYMAPEQFAGQARPATDVYGVAATGVHLLSGTSPQEMLNERNELEWESYADPSEPTRMLLDAMLTRDVSDRPSDAAALAEEMREIASAETGEVVEIDESLVESPPDAAADSAGASLPETAEWRSYLDVSASPPRDVPADLGDRLAVQSVERRKSVLIVAAAILPLLVLGVALVAAYSTMGAVAVAFVGLVLTIAGPGSFWHTYSEELERVREAYRTGTLLTGTVTGSESVNLPIESSPDAAIVRYEFQAPEGGESVTGRVTTPAPKLPAKGDPVPVLYDREAPERNVAIVDYLS